MDFTKPVVGDAYTLWSSILIQNMTDMSKQFDGVGTMTGVVTGTIRFSSTAFRWEKWNGSAWVELLLKASQTYDIRVFDSINLNGQAASYYLSLANASGSLAADKGGTGQTSYAVGDLLYASAATTMSKLADIAVGNVLLSGGVGVAPSYGKVSLTVHVSGLLPAANGGTGIGSYTTGNYLNALNSTTLQQRTPAQVKTDLALVKADVGLSNVDNTADTAKPVSAAQQAAIDAKAPMNLQQNTQNANYTLALTDNNDFVYKTDGAAYAWTIPPNSSVAFPVGAMVSFVNDGTAGNITLTQGAGVTIQLAGGTTVGNRTLARGGLATALKVGTDKWFVSGAGVT